MESKVVLAYAIYLPVVLLLTLYVARTLFRNARVFMLDIFRGKTDIADATNKLFEVGFYLLNMGFALLILRIEGPRAEWNMDLQQYAVPTFLTTDQEVVEALAGKIGGFALYLGALLFLNLYLFFRGRRKSRENTPFTPRTVPEVTMPA
jgi:hypothetical protein